MRLAAISMIRDESDVIAPFLGHLAAFFDDVFLLDQRSSDGSSETMREACASRAGWSYQHMDFAGRHQKEVKTHFMRRAFALGADMLFLIDSDEFVAFRDRDALVAALSPFRRATDPIGFRLRPCVPQQFDEWHFDPRKPLWIGGPPSVKPATLSVSIKVAVPRALFEADAGIQALQGNHGVVSPTRGVMPATALAGDFYHVPIRSRQQFIQKVFLSAIANFAKNNPMTAEGVHKRRLLEAIGERELTDDAMTVIAAQYPPGGQIAWWPSPVNLEEKGFFLGHLETGFAEMSLAGLPRPRLERIVARSLASFMMEDVEAGKGSLVFEEGSVRFQVNKQDEAETSGGRP